MGKDRNTHTGWRAVLTLTTVAALAVGRPSPLLQCPAEDPRGHTLLLPHPADCRQYLVCEHGSARAAHCPAGLHFHPALHVCDWPGRVRCAAPVAKETALAAVQCSFRDPRAYTVLAPHPTHCRLYYRCDYGIPRLETCAGGLHFNPALQVCDWPGTADCRARHYDPFHLALRQAVRTERKWTGPWEKVIGDFATNKIVYKSVGTG